MGAHSEVRFLIFTSATTPTISRMREPFSSTEMPGRMRLPIGFSPGKNCRASDSLTMTTGVGVRPILRREIAALQQGNFHGAKIIRSDREKVGVWLVAFGHRATFNRNVRLHFRARHRQRKDSGHGFCARKRRQLPHQLTRELILLRVGIFLVRQINVCRQNIVRIEPGIHVLQPRQAADQKARTYQQNERNRHFDNHERASQAGGAGCPRWY